MSLKIAVALFGLCIPSFATGANETVERLPFATGGVIRILNSSGVLKVEGWDRPAVEITVQQSPALSGSEKARVVSDRHSEIELQISTILPPRVFTRWLGDKGSFLRGTGAALDKVTGAAAHPLGGPFKLEYLIHVPHQSQIVIHHRKGYVLVSNVGGDVEATSTGGDVVLMLPEANVWSIDAKSKLGTVASDFEGAGHRRLVVGSALNREVPSPAHRIYVRTGVGGITIKAVPVESQDPIP